MAEKETKDIIEEKKKFEEYTAKLNEYREHGADVILAEKTHIEAVKKNRLLTETEKKDLISESNQKITEAKKVVEAHKEEESKLVKEAIKFSNDIFENDIKNIIQTENNKIASFKSEYKQKIADIKKEGQEKKANIEQMRKSAETAIDKQSFEIELKKNQQEQKALLFSAKNKFENLVQSSKDVKRQAFVDHVQQNIALRNGKTNIRENIVLSFHEYIYKFKLSTFLLNNGLYIALAIFFVICVILAPLSGSGNLLTLSNIFTILEQTSTRMFYALGVAGIILLSGTDLSIGRMVALGAVITGLILHPGMNIVTLFGLGPWDFSAMPVILKLSLALTLSIVLCSLFSAFAGYFSARLKIHPFISTLATQLMIYGLLFFGTSGTPVGSINSEIKDMLGGRWVLGFFNGQLITLPKLIVPAIIAIIIAWFIWNKTTFGKNMYAVGGNPEAASVSGISVFKVTMMTFIMAGIFYGVGSFFEAFRANASAGTGQGYELDAIAACVVGGISFKGGIGKISGAVLGVIIFTSLTYCLTFLSIDTNLQFVFKGFIIIIAVALDSVKYIQKK
ncbi:MAG: galactoside ABC transporter permease [Treponema sp.]|nr:MAG: galactoside ABC transporter permease [Treponema sp.]